MAAAALAAQLCGAARLRASESLVEALALSLPLLRDALILISFFFVVFGYMGLELWLGLFRARCFDLKTGLEVQPHIFNACALNNVYVFGGFSNGKYLNSIETLCSLGVSNPPRPKRSSSNKSKSKKSKSKAVDDVVAAATALW